MKTKAQWGMALVLVMCVIFTLSMIIASLLQMTSTQLIVARAQRDAEASVYVAEAGLERAASYIANDGNVPCSFAGTIGDGTYCVTIINGSTPAEGNHTVAGAIMINPNNNPANEFTVALPGGGSVTRDMLTQDYAGYTGPALSVHVKPKGAGNQNQLQLDGEVFSLLNANTYDVVSDIMVVNIYNDKINGSGKAVGMWWVAIATTAAVISETP